MNTVLLKLSSNVQFTDNTDNTNTRQFSGVAHSGKPFEYCGTRYVVDLTDIRPLDSSIGVLIEHNAHQRAGVGRLSVQNHQLLISGSLLDNEFGRAIAQDSDGDFPFEMSAHIQSGSVEEITGDNTIEVNGQILRAPIKVLRHCLVREVSFVAVGVDQHTHAVVLSQGKETHMQEEEIQKLLDKIQALEAENAALKEEKARESQKAKVNQKLSQAGFMMNEDGHFAHLSPDTYALLLLAGETQLDNIVGDLKLGLKPNALPEYFQEDKEPETTLNLQLSAKDEPHARTLGGYPIV